MSYQLLYSETSRKQIGKLHPDIKPVVKSKIENLQHNPFAGKLIERKLSGYLSLPAERFRIIQKLEGMIRP
jgi:mRNA-degrading endonuclease RelE of RelBE toxin-antitoxin system